MFWIPNTDWENPIIPWGPPSSSRQDNRDHCSELPLASSDPLAWTLWQRHLSLARLLPCPWHIYSVLALLILSISFTNGIQLKIFELPIHIPKCSSYHIPRAPPNTSPWFREPLLFSIYLEDHLSPGSIAGKRILGPFQKLYQIMAFCWNMNSPLLKIVSLKAENLPQYVFSMNDWGIEACRYPSDLYNMNPHQNILQKYWL